MVVVVVVEVVGVVVVVVVVVVSKHCGMTIQLVLSVKDAYFLSIPLLVRKNSWH